MILQSLVKCYEKLKNRGLVPEQYFILNNVSFQIDIKSNGEINYIKPFNEYDEKKKLYKPITIITPETANRSSNIVSSFLCDKTQYILGFNEDGISKKSENSFKEAKKLHNKILKNITSESAEAIKNFFNTWDPQEYQKHIPAEFWGYINKANVVLSYKDKLLTEDKELTDIWKKYATESDSSKIGQCLITGQITNLVDKHAKIKNVNGAQSSGASLVSFADEAYESYGLAKHENAQIGSYAAFAYVTALNYMLAHPEYKILVGDTTIVCWAETSEECYSKLVKEMLGQEYYDSLEEQQEYLKQTLKGLFMEKPLSYKNDILNGKIKFYILGLNPNAGRIAIKFFYSETYNKIISNIYEHYNDFEIEKPDFEKFKFTPLWLLVQEIVGRNKQILLTEKIITSILENNLYPASMLQNTIIRIHAEKDKPASPTKASIIKGYLSRYNKKYNKDKEKITMALNPECKDIPYVLGRMFATYEQIQDIASNGTLNNPIKNRYFSLCMSTPAIGYPILGKLSINHLRKLDTPLAIQFEKKIRSLLDLLEKKDGESIFPKKLSLQEQGEYYLGYYHETQKRYEKKEKKDNE